MDRVAQHHLKPLQWAVEGRADRGIPEVESQCSFVVSPSSVQIRLEAFGRERCFDFCERLLRVGEGIDAYPAIRHAPPCKPRTRLCPSVCARGVVLRVSIILLSFATSRLY